MTDAVGTTALEQETTTGILSPAGDTVDVIDDFDAAFDEIAAQDDLAASGEGGAEVVTELADDAGADLGAGGSVSVETETDNAGTAATDPWGDAPPVLREQFVAEQHKARSAEGRLSAHQREINGLKQQLATMQANPPAAQQAAPTVEIPAVLQEAFSAEELEGFQQMAAAMNQQQVATLQAEVDTLAARDSQRVDDEQAAAATEVRTAHETYLDKESAGWRDLDADPGFLGWLAQEDAATGLSRQELFTVAYQNGRTPGVARFYKEYQQQATGGQGARSGANNLTAERRAKLPGAVQTNGRPGGVTPGGAPDDFDAAFDYYADRPG